MVFWLNLNPQHYENCEIYTKEMNGGIRVFHGEKFNIVLCGTGAYNRSSDPGARLQVLSMDGELLAERFFEPPWEMVYDIQYGEDYLGYETRDQGPTQNIGMPPSSWEWIRARLPRLWPLR